MAPHLVHQFWGSNSDAVSQLLVREVILAEQVEVLPGNRRAKFAGWGWTAIEGTYQTDRPDSGSKQ